MRAALYIRVSDEEQAKEGYSIEAQRSLLMREASKHGMAIVDEYIDEGYSAKNMKRPDLQRILEDIEKLGIQVIFFWRLDRLTRRSRDFHNLHEKLQKMSCGIKSATEQIDTTTAFGRFQLELSVSLAQLERETNSERVSFVMTERARKGMRNGAPAPLGYDLVDGNLVVNPDKAKLLNRIYKLYLDGTGMKNIAHILNREGIPGGYNALWSAPAIKYILSNPVYIGKLRWSNELEEVEHEKIIDENVFYRVQDVIESRKSGGKKITSDFLFSSVARCGRCGYAMQGFSNEYNGTRYKRYRCGNKVDRGLCNAHNVLESKVEEAFLDALNLDEAELQKYVTIQVNEENSEVEELKKELEAIARRKKKWQTMYANDLATLDDVKANTEPDILREKIILKQLESAKTPKSHWTKEELIKGLKKLKNTWDVIESVKVKKQFILESFEYIVIDVIPQGKRKTEARIVDFRFRV